MNLEEIFALMDRFEKSGLDVLKIKQEDFTIVLKKHPAVPASQPVMIAPHPATPQTAPVAAPTTQEGAEGISAAAPGAPDLEVITSPIVGTFYRAPSPDAPPFVEEGQRVERGQTLCIIEAMKIMNELEAEFPMEIVRVLAENGQMVEYGTPLFEVRRL